jgi:glycosyltransferase involved in cell wall biosynthesis
VNITTLVPAYKPKYLPELLTALLNQTVKPERIIISDDSPDQAFMAALTTGPLGSARRELNISVIPGPRSGAYNNFRRLLQAWNGQTELFHFLLDDDIIYPAFYERHLAAHVKASFGCSISRRWTALESGQPVGQLTVPSAVTIHSERMMAIGADAMFGTTIPQYTNWFGEFSNVVFAARLADMVHEPYMDSICYTGLEDLGAFLNASRRGPVAWINDYLGFFRRGPLQHSFDPMGRSMKLAHLAWFALAIAGRRVSRLNPAQVAECFTRLGAAVLKGYAHEADMAPFREVISGLMSGQASAEDRFVEIWHAYLGLAS